MRVEHSSIFGSSKEKIPENRGIQYTTLITGDNSKVNLLLAIYLMEQQGKKVLIVTSASSNRDYELAHRESEYVEELFSDKDSEETLKSQLDEYEKEIETKVVIDTVIQILTEEAFTDSKYSKMLRQRIKDLAPRINSISKSTFINVYPTSETVGIGNTVGELITDLVEVTLENTGTEVSQLAHRKDIEAVLLAQSIINILTDK